MCVISLTGKDEQTLWDLLVSRHSYVLDRLCAAYSFLDRDKLGVDNFFTAVHFLDPRDTQEFYTQVLQRCPYLPDKIRAGGRDFPVKEISYVVDTSDRDLLARLGG